MSAVIQTRDLTVRYDDVLALDAVTLSVPAGTITGVLGPNGSGKSTLVKALIGAVPASGDASILGERGAAAARCVAYIPQQSSSPLDFPATIEDVVWQGRYGTLGLLGRKREGDRRIVDDAIARVGLADLRHRPIGALSGGQRQRAFFARALARQASVLLLDEPFAGVDATTEATLMDVLGELRDEGATILLVHHNLATARSYFDRIVLIHQRLVASGPTADVFTPALVSEAYGGNVAIFIGGEHAP